MAQSILIPEADMRGFLEDRGFRELQGLTFHGRPVRELVFGLRVDETLSLRVYTTVERGVTRAKGTDAIRVCLFQWTGKEPRLVGADVRVHRVVGWRENLADRLDNWQDLTGPDCPRCGCMTVKRPKFWGCSNFPTCRGSLPLTAKAVGVVIRDEVHETRPSINVVNPRPVAVLNVVMNDSFFDGLLDC